MSLAFKILEFILVARLKLSTTLIILERGRGWRGAWDHQRKAKIQKSDWDGGRKRKEDVGMYSGFTAYFRTFFYSVLIKLNGWLWFNPIALRTAKTLWSLGLSDCNRVYCLFTNNNISVISSHCLCSSECVRR